MEKDLRKKPDAKLIGAIAANLAVGGAEVVGGIYSGSLSLLSDALHNASDAVSLFISLIAIKLGRRGHTESRTFGYKRAEIMAALLNASILVIVSFFLFKEAVERLIHPSDVNSRAMMAVAAAALVVNTGSASGMKAHGIKIEKNDKVTVSGSYIDVCGNPELLASKITVNHHTLQLRDDHGRPLWDIMSPAQ